MSEIHDDNAIATYFDQCAGAGLMYQFEPAEQVKLNAFLSEWDIAPGQRVLEPGCGSGRLTQALAKATGPSGEVYACDLSPAMIQLARERGMPGHVHLACGSTRHIARDGAWFDRIICLNVFPHILDKSGALTEFARVMKPSGRLWINHFRGRDDLNHFHQHAAAEVSSHQLPCAHTMRTLLDEAGFELLDLRDQAESYSLQARPRTSPDL